MKFLAIDEPVLGEISQRGRMMTAVSRSNKTRRDPVAKSAKGVEDIDLAFGELHRDRQAGMVEEIVTVQYRLVATAP
jgi:hypothetical protein